MKLPFKSIIILVFLYLFNLSYASLKYDVINGFVVSTNSEFYNNRPLYCIGSRAVVLSGNKPIVKLINGNTEYGTLQIGFSRNGVTKWLENCSDIQFKFRENSISWTISDLKFRNLQINLQVVPIKNEEGFVTKIGVTGIEKNDSLHWKYGGIVERDISNNLNWYYDILVNPSRLNEGYNSTFCKNNIVKIQKSNFQILSNKNNISTKKVSGFSTFSEINEIYCAIDETTEVTGRTKLERDGNDNYFAVWITKNNTEYFEDVSAKEVFNSSLAHERQIANNVTATTPNKYFNVLTSACNTVLNAVYSDSVFVHGAMAWNLPYLGWRSVFGPTVYNLHQQVKNEAIHYFDYQNTDSSKTKFISDPALGNTLEALNSRYYGKGRILKDQYFYNMQSPFFDQIIHFWRWTGDKDIEKKLFPALNLHLEWQKACFDADNNGTYESYVNTWASDSFWNNGGGSSEETAYAYAGNLAALKLAQINKDEEKIKFYTSEIKRIKKGFFDELWISKKGHPGLYREFGNHKRLHEDAWLYSIFLPIDARLLDEYQSIEALYYTEYVLQNQRMPNGGRTVWTSNFVPSIWSVRENVPSDNYHLALMYFKCGLIEDGWDILNGNMIENGFNSACPANFGSSNTSLDFTDCSSMFGRVVVEGVGGYMPDYMNGKITVSPKFLKEWNHASIKTPEYLVKLSKSKECVTYNFTFTKKESINFELPIFYSRVEKVLVNGVKIPYISKPGIGCQLICFSINNQTKSEIKVDCKNLILLDEIVAKKVSIGEKMILQKHGYSIVEVIDNQGVFESKSVEHGKLSATISNNIGHHTFFLILQCGNAKIIQVNHIYVANSQIISTSNLLSKNDIELYQRWKTIDISKKTNGNIQTIFKQKYISPHLESASVHIGDDGYSPWTFYYWQQGEKAPKIDLNNIPALLTQTGELKTSEGVPFLWSGNENNIIFTSLWDNYPDSAKIVINEKAKGLWVLVSGTTNPMQCNIKNAEIRVLYTDGSIDKIELIPPINFWTLCPIQVSNMMAGQNSRAYYDYSRDGFCLPSSRPEIVSLGNNCNAVLLGLKTKSDVEIENVVLETFSQEVVIGLLGVTLMK